MKKKKKNGYQQKRDAKDHRKKGTLDPYNQKIYDQELAAKDKVESERVAREEAVAAALSKTEYALQQVNKAVSDQGKALAALISEKDFALELASKAESSLDQAMAILKSLQSCQSADTESAAIQAIDSTDTSVEAMLDGIEPEEFSDYVSTQPDTPSDKGELVGNIPAIDIIQSSPHAERISNPHNYIVGGKDCKDWLDTDSRWDAFVDDSTISKTLRTRVQTLRISSLRERMKKNCMCQLAFWSADWENMMQEKKFTPPANDWCWSKTLVGTMTTRTQVNSSVARSSKFKVPDTLPGRMADVKLRSNGVNIFYGQYAFWIIIVIEGWSIGKYVDFYRTNEGLQWSHLCGTADCTRPDHGLYETCSVNTERKRDHVNANVNADYECTCASGLPRCNVPARHSIGTLQKYINYGKTLYSDIDERVKRMKKALR